MDCAQAADFQRTGALYVFQRQCSRGPLRMGGTSARYRWLRHRYGRVRHDGIAAECGRGSRHFGAHRGTHHQCICARRGGRRPAHRRARCTLAAACPPAGADGMLCCRQLRKRAHARLHFAPRSSFSRRPAARRVFRRGVAGCRITRACKRAGSCDRPNDVGPYRCNSGRGAFGNLDRTDTGLARGLCSGGSHRRPDVCFDCALRAASRPRQGREPRP